MKILQVTNHFFPHKGGIEEAVFCLSRELVRKGHEVTVVCSDDPAVGDLTVENIRIRRLPVSGKISNTNITGKLFSELLRAEYDIIHTHLPYPWNASISSFVSSFRRKPLFLTYNNDIGGSGLNGCIAEAYNYFLLPFLLHRAERIFIWHADYLKESRFLKKHAFKVTVALPGVDTTRFRPQEITRTETNAVFFLSILDKLHEYKGLSYLLESIKLLRSKFPVKLYVGGKGDRLDFYQDLVTRNGLADTVTFLGYMKDEDIVKYYNMCDVFVLPSVSSIEGFGLVALEAMACRKPVIVTKYVGVALDVQAANAGLVVESSNAAALADALHRILSHKDEAQAMGQQAYMLIAKKYLWGLHADIIEDAYKESLNKKRP
jgi:glycosyltransferase involved in cell wall biosynthesis